MEQKDGYEMEPSAWVGWENHLWNFFVYNFFNLSAISFGLFKLKI